MKKFATESLAILQDPGPIPSKKKKKELKLEEMFDETSVMCPK